jgi:hypothetical protein
VHFKQTCYKSFAFTTLITVSNDNQPNYVQNIYRRNSVSHTTAFGVGITVLEM